SFFYCGSSLSMLRLIAAKYWPKISSSAAPLSILLRFLRERVRFLKGSRVKSGRPVRWPEFAGSIFAGRSRGHTTNLCPPSERRTKLWRYSHHEGRMGGKKHLSLACHCPA